MKRIAKWGFLRETKVAAHKAGIDRATGLHRTGLDEYLKVIFPEVKDWIHDMYEKRQEKAEQKVKRKL